MPAIFFLPFSECVLLMRDHYNHLYGNQACNPWTVCDNLPIKQDGRTCVCVRVRYVVDAADELNIQWNENDIME